jgi:hypothetical protein
MTLFPLSWLVARGWGLGILRGCEVVLCGFGGPFSFVFEYFWGG